MIIIKTNSKVLKITFICTLISILLIIYFFNKNFDDKEIGNLFLNISVGMLGSSVVSLFITIPSYFVSRKQTLYNYYENYYKKIIEISKIPFYELEVDGDAFVNYINERNNNIMYRDMGLKENKDNPCKDKMIEEFKKSKKAYLKFMDEKEFDKYINSNFDKWICGETEKIDKILEEYHKIATTSIYDLKSLLGDMEFPLFNGNLDFINNKLHEPLCNFLNSIISFDRHISLYLNGEGNQSFVIHELLRIQNELLFKIDQEEFEGHIMMTVYFKWVDDIEYQLEVLRSKIFHDRLRYKKPIPIITSAKEIK